MPRDPLRFTCAIVLLLGALAGCSDLKSADASAGLAFVAGVDPVVVDGRKMIQLRTGQALMVVDPQGGKVVDYHLQSRAKVKFVDDPDGGDGPKMIRPPDPPGKPNVLGLGGWRSVCIPPRPQIDDASTWQIDAGAIFLTLLTDTKDGLRWRRTYTLNDNSSVVVVASLENTTGKPIETGAMGALALPADAKITRDGDTTHAWSNGQWFSRRFVSGAIRPSDSAAEDPFRFPPTIINGREKLEWTEQWWITQDSAGTRTPSNPPRL